MERGAGATAAIAAESAESAECRAGAPPMSALEEIHRGRPGPLGATWDGGGVNFALFSERATAVDLCLFDSPQAGERARLRLPARSGDIWHGYVPGAEPGALYAYRVHGPWDPAAGSRFDPHKLLVDPYARALTGPVIWNEALVSRARESADFVPRCVVVDPAFDWGEDAPPQVPWSRTLLYECHVKGMTQLHPGVPPALRGTFAALALPPVTEHLHSLGVTALCLMPVHHSALDPHLGPLGLTNYWGYATLGFFAPDSRFASASRGQQVREFQSMVRELHRSGLEVILDVVYNHTPEADVTGSTLSLRGIDDAAYYRSAPGRPADYEDFTGCGNTLDLRHPRVLELVVDSLRYWVSEMHVDGFRFDLAPALARRDPDMDPAGPFFEALHRDPLLSRVKLIAEPWDLGPHPVQLGRFPPGWREWNDRYRDTLRRFWRGDAGQRGEFATRLCGSDDLFAKERGPLASINFATCHDGFTLEDLVRYERKHNEQNGEANRDGHGDNASCNWGEEGPSLDSRVVQLRERAKRNLMATLAFSLGVPMLSHGDELGRTQRGNNNAYCQDGPLTWIDWEDAELDERKRAFLSFVQQVFAIRRVHSVFRSDRFFPAEQVEWFAADGSRLDDSSWWHHAPASFAVRISPEAAATGGTGQPGTAILMLFNPNRSATRFVLPDPVASGSWRKLLDTATGNVDRSDHGALELASFSLVLLEESGAS